MIAEFIALSFATTVAWEMFRSIIWFNINVRVAPFLIAWFAFGLSFLDHPSVLLALAATGGVAVIHKIIDATGVEPLKWKSRKKETPLPGRGHKIPGL